MDMLITGANRGIGLALARSHQVARPGCAASNLSVPIVAKESKKKNIGISAASAMVKLSPTMKVSDGRR